MKPSVSVVIPVHNGEAFLAEAIDSVLGQTYPCSELIVVDDGSEDATERVARSFPQVTYRRIDRLSPAASRNEGIRLARGALIGLLDHDDIWTRDKTEKQIQVLRSRQEVEAVFGLIEEFHDVRDLKTYRPPTRGLHLSPGTMLARRELFSRVGPFDESFSLGEWAQWYVRARDAGLIEVVLPEVVLRRRIHGKNLTARRSDRMHEYIQVVRESLERRRAAEKREQGTDPRHGSA